MSMTFQNKRKVKTTFSLEVEIFSYKDEYFSVWYGDVKTPEG